MDNSISTNNLDWRNYISIWADGAKAVSGSRSGLQSLIQEHAPMAKWMHRMIHREALVARELSLDLGATVDRHQIYQLHQNTAIKVKSV